MKWTGRLLFCLFCFLSLGCFCFPQEQPAVILSGEEVQAVLAELNGMKLAVKRLKESQTVSGTALQSLQEECRKLETKLKQALAGLEESQAQLVQLDLSRNELTENLATLNQEYAELSQSYFRLQKRNKIVCWVCGGLVVGLGVTTVALFLR